MSLFNDLDFLQKIYWSIALVSTAFFAIYFFVVGVRRFFNNTSSSVWISRVLLFCFGFGWFGVCYYYSVKGIYLVGISVLVGILMLYLGRRIINNS